MSRSAAKKSNKRLWIIWFIFLVLCVFCEMSLFGVCGKAGVYIRKGLLGSFGLIGYAFPVLAAVWLFMVFRFHGTASSVMKAIAAILLIWDICAIIQHLALPEMLGASYREIFDYCAKSASGGGVCGSVIVRFMSPALGRIGLAFILIIIGLLLSELLTDFALIRFFRRIGSDRSGSSPRRGKSRRSRQDAVQTPKRAARRKNAEEQPQYFDMKDTDRNDLVDHRSSSAGDDSLFTTIGGQKEKVRRQRKKTKGTLLGSSPEIMEIGQEKKGSGDTGTLPMFHTLEDSLPEKKETPEKPAAPKKKAKSGQAGTSKKKETTGKTPAKEEIKEEIVVPESSLTAESHYEFPPYRLLTHGNRMSGDSKAYLRETALKLQETLQSFGVNVTVTDVSCGPAVTRYELQPEAGVKVSRIVALESDIKLNLAASDIRIEAPIPGKAAVGIEVPNKTNSTVMLRDLLEDESFRSQKSHIAFAAGRDIAGKPVIADIQKMPHVLIAGATGSGKSVCINTIIMSILYSARPDEVKLIMIDPKVVELSVYNNIPHLLIPVVTDPKKAAGALNWAVAEMTKRYKKFALYGVRKIEEYNTKIAAGAEKASDDGEVDRPMPQIVIIVDELADLMMVSSKEVEDAIVRLTQLARAAGIHLVIATQRPSVNVITGLIKANMPSRIAFAVTSGVDSRTILDMNGAEKLLGRGDMLFFPSGYPKPVRVQGAFVSDREVSDVVNYVISHNQESSGYDDDVVRGVEASTSAGAASPIDGGESYDNEYDEYFEEAARFIIEKEKASIGMLQRRFKIGFNRAARMMDQLCEAGVVGEEEGTKPRRILMTTIEEFEQRGEKE
ncbi:MAG: DNA translocase FtsK [Lachnospiraceae bacterium]|nr:DNA translocase FtsK [Lachnospiraceae bacterium]